MPKAKTINVKRCANCGGKGYFSPGFHYDKHRVCCYICGKFTEEFDTKEQAVKAWNKGEIL